MKPFQINGFKETERGSAAVKFGIVVLLIFLIAHAGYNYVPIAYEAQDLRQEMQTAITQGAVVVGKTKPIDSIKLRFAKTFRSFDIPSNAFFNVQEVNGTIQARLAYTKRINILPFGIYQYDYVFDNTVTPVGFDD